MRLTESILRNLNESEGLDRFAKDLETALIDSGYKVKTSDYTYFGVSSGGAEMTLTIYEGGSNSSDFEKDTIGLGGDNDSEQIVLPIYPDSSWDYETGTPSGAPEVGSETYAIFKQIDKTSINEVVDVINSSFKAALNTGELGESDDIKVIDSDKKVYKTIMNNYSKPIKFEVKNSNGGLLGGSPTLDGAKEIARKQIEELKDDPWNKGMTVHIERLKEEVNNLKEESVLVEKPVYMNTWKNYNEYGADLSAYGIQDGWMTIDDALAFCEKYAEDEPFINDTDGVPIEISDYDNAVERLNELKKIEEADVDKDVLTAFLETGSYDDIDEIIEKIESGDYIFFPDVDSDSGLAEAYIEMCGSIVDAVGDSVSYYFDEDAWKRDAEDDIRNMIADDEGKDIDEVTDEEVNDYLDSIMSDEISVAEHDHNDEFFERYFDYDAYGRDLGFDFTFTSTGAIDIL